MGLDEQCNQCFYDAERVSLYTWYITASYYSPMSQMKRTVNAIHDLLPSKLTAQWIEGIVSRIVAKQVIHKMQFV